MREFISLPWCKEPSLFHQPWPVAQRRRGPWCVTWIAPAVASSKVKHELHRARWQTVAPAHKRFERGPGHAAVAPGAPALALNRAAGGLLGQRASSPAIAPRRIIPFINTAAAAGEQPAAAEDAGCEVFQGPESESMQRLQLSAV